MNAEDPLYGHTLKGFKKMAELKAAVKDAGYRAIVLMHPFHETPNWNRGYLGALRKFLTLGERLKGKSLAATPIIILEEHHRVEELKEMLKREKIPEPFILATTGGGPHVWTDLPRKPKAPEPWKSVRSYEREDAHSHSAMMRFLREAGVKKLHLGGMKAGSHESDVVAAYEKSRLPRKEEKHGRSYPENPMVEGCAGDFYEKMAASGLFDVHWIKKLTDIPYYSPYPRPHKREFPRKFRVRGGRYGAVAR